MSLEENTDKNKNKQFINQNDVIQENEKKEIDTSNLKKNENQFLSSTLSSNKNQDLSKTDLFKFNPIIPDFLLSNNEPNNKYNFFQSKKVSTSDIKESENNNITSEKLCCNCTKTKCVKKYCECYKSNQKCTYKCRCVNCKNGVKASFNVNVPESDNIINKESINKDNEIINNIVENNSVDKNEKINLGIGDKNNKKINSRKSSNENNNENKNYQIQRVSVFINKYKTVIDVEKFTKEMMLISKKRKRLKK